MTKPTLLILSFSPLYRDARVLKQINLFKDQYDVTTCGYGPPPMEGVTHIEIPEQQGMWDLNGRFITLRLYSRVYWDLDGVNWVWDRLKGRKFDGVLANDYDTVPIGVRLKPRHGVHADLHEYAPSQGEENEAWARRIKPWREWVLKRYATKAASSTTVCEGLAEKFQTEFGFKPSVVTNAAPYADLQPEPVHSPLRLVHHGAANPNRGIDWMIRSISASSRDFVFDLYLPHASSGAVEVLRKQAESDPRITVKDAVPYTELIPLLNTYDVGISAILPNTFNLKHALPNKIFDYVQARLGIITGPSPEMARLVREHDLGLVLPDFSEEALTDAITNLDPAKINLWKQNANQVAEPLSSHNQNQGWADPISKLLGPIA